MRFSLHRERIESLFDAASDSQHWENRLSTLFDQYKIDRVEEIQATIIPEFFCRNAEVLKRLYIVCTKKNEPILGLTAFMGDTKKIQYLRRHHPSAFVQKAEAMGAALGGHADLMWSLATDRLSRDGAVFGAALGGYADLVHALIKRKASLEGAIFGAACGGHADLVWTLIAAGASCDSAVHGAALGKHSDLMNALIAKDASRDSAVHGAASGGHISLMQILITEGASRHHAVHGAAMNGYAAVMCELIREGASLNFALDGAAAHRQNDLIHLLIELGAPLNSAVYAAACHGKADLVRKLIVEGASPDNALYGALNGRFIELMALLESTADHRLLILRLAQYENAFKTEIEVLRFLSELNSPEEVYIYVNHYLPKECLVTTPPKTLIRSARLLHNLKNTFLSPKLKEAWAMADMGSQFWFLSYKMGFFLLNVASFLFPSLEEDEIIDLHTFFRTHFDQHFHLALVKIKLNAYCQLNEQAKTILHHASQAETKEALLTALREAKALLEQQKPDSLTISRYIIKSILGCFKKPKKAGPGPENNLLHLLQSQEENLLQSQEKNHLLTERLFP